MSQLKTIPAPYGKDVVDDDGNKMSHVIGAGVDQGAAPPQMGEMLAQLQAMQAQETEKPQPEPEAEPELEDIMEEFGQAEEQEE